MALRKSLRRIGALGSAAVMLTSTAVFLDVASPIPADAVVNETLTLQSNNPDGVMTTSVLQEGVPYEISIEGSYLYTAYGIAGQGAQQFGGSIADAECTDLGPDKSLQRNRWVWFDPGGDYGDVYLEDQNIEWQPVNPDNNNCDPDHKYTFTYVPEATKQVKFGVHEGSVLPSAIGDSQLYEPRGFYGDNFGFFTIKISEQSTALDTFDVNSADPAGSFSNVSLDPTKTYKIQVEGTYLPSAQKQGEQLGLPGVAHIVADAECSSVDNGPASPESPLSTAETFGDGSDDYWDVRVDGQFVSWVPADGSLTGCDATHTYFISYKPPVAGPVNLSVYDSWIPDNVGSLVAKIFVTESPVSAPAALPNLTLGEELTVDSANGAGTNNRIPLVEGQAYLIKARGVYGWFYGAADAECSHSNLDQTWLENRFASISPNKDLLDLGINNQSVTWVATQANSDGCNLIDHSYTTYYVPASTGTINFKVLTDNPGINFGTFTVQIFHVTEVPVGVVQVNTRSKDGSLTPPLLAGNKYRLATSGTWSWWTGNGNYLADAECSRSDRNPWMENQFAGDPLFAGYEDLLDLLVNGTHHDWKPVNASSGCDPEHEYTLEIKPAVTGPVTLSVDDLRFDENGDGMQVVIYKLLD